MKYLIIGGLLLLAAQAWAQTAREVANLAAQPELQAEINLSPSGDYLLMGLRGFRFLDYNSPSTRFGFDERQLRLGYEHFWNEYWSAGATARLVGNGHYSEVVPELLLRHRNSLGPLTFGQRLSLERAVSVNSDYQGNPRDNGRTFARLRLDLDKLLPLGSLTLRPRLSYEVAAQLRLQKEATDLPIRTIGYGSLRGEVGLRLGDHVDVTPWFAYQTNYLETLPQYNAMGQQVSGGKLNVVSPTLGLDLRFTLPSLGGVSDRQQLPTQH